MVVKIGELIVDGCGIGIQGGSVEVGNAQITTRNLTIVKIDKENNLLLVRGGIPGPNGGIVLVRPTTKKKGTGPKKTA